VAAWEPRSRSLERVCERGEARRIFEILPKVDEKVYDALATSLLSRPALPLAEAQAVISSPDERTTQLAAQILGRAGTRAAESGPAVQAALSKWRDVWEERRRKISQEAGKDDR